jgi:hypothetical protein
VDQRELGQLRCWPPAGVAGQIAGGGAGQEHPLLGFPEYAEMLEDLSKWRAEPPTVEHMTVIGSYRLF